MLTKAIPSAAPPHAVPPQVADATSLTQAFLAGEAYPLPGTWPPMPPGRRLGALLRSLLQMGVHAVVGPACNLVEALLRIMFKAGCAREGRGPSF